jgi:N-succinyldiaminopimelate aminotransferase
MKILNKNVSNFKESIFSTMTKMANENKAINLSQGFPDFDGPSWLINLAKDALSEGHLGKNQYAPSMGILPLRQAIAHNYKRFYNLEYNPETEIVVTAGATEAIFCVARALLNAGDEVIVLEPCYDSYVASIEMCDAKIVPVTLKLPNFTFDLEELKSAITKNTKLLILNNPHNPTGKVFTKNELELIAELAIENDFYILSDEVYEFLTYDCAHNPTATIKNLKDRTITVSSTGKTFGVTGWKIGWAAAPAHLIKAIHNVHQFTTFCVSHPFQVAMAKALMNMDEYLIDFRAAYTEKKNLLVNGLKDLGFEIIEPQGTYFVIAKTSNNLDDVSACKRLILENKVATIPTSAFYLKSDEGKQLIRFCFAKKEETLKAALVNLK